MNRIRILVFAVAVSLVVTTAASSTSPPRLTGTVGPGFTISLKRNAKLVRTLTAGRYTFVVSDRATIHNFHLKGPGISRVITGIGAVGTKTVTLALKRGTYTYVCDLHPSLLGHFKVL